MDNITGKGTKREENRYEVSLFDNHFVSSRPLKKTTRTKEKSSLFYLGYVGQIGFVIAIPIAGGAGLGSYLDAKWGTYPKMTLALLCIGIVISIVNFISVIKEIITGSKN